MHSYAGMDRERKSPVDDRRTGRSDPHPGPRDEIDENLKRVYSRLVEEEVPDRFRKLLEELRRKESGR